MFTKEGRFVRDVEPKTIPGRDGVPFTAINARMVFNTFARGKQQSLFVDVNFTGENAEWIVRNILKDGKTGKGMMVRVGGEMYEEEYTKDGEKRRALRMDADFVKYAPMFNTNSQSGDNATRSASAASASQPASKGEAVASTSQDNDPFFTSDFDFPDLITEEEESA